MFNDDLFLAVVTAAGEKKADAAKAIGICDAALYKKRKGICPFTLEDMWNFKKHYGLTNDDMCRIFFA